MWTMDSAGLGGFELSRFLYLQTWRTFYCIERQAYDRTWSRCSGPQSPRNAVRFNSQMHSRTGLRLCLLPQMGRSQIGLAVGAAASLPGTPDDVFAGTSSR